MTPEFMAGERVTDRMMACGECKKEARESTFPDTVTFLNEETMEEETHPICQDCIDRLRDEQLSEEHAVASDLKHRR